MSEIGEILPITMWPSRRKTVERKTVSASPAHSKVLADYACASRPSLRDVRHFGIEVPGTDCENSIRRLRSSLDDFAASTICASCAFHSDITRFKAGVFL